MYRYLIIKYARMHYFHRLIFFKRLIENNFSCLNSLLLQVLHENDFDILCSFAFITLQQVACNNTNCGYRENILFKSLLLKLHKQLQVCIENEIFLRYISVILS